MLLIVGVRTGRGARRLQRSSASPGVVSPVVRPADYLAKSIKSMKVMLADGSLQTVSANENKDLFNLVVGGYGPFGVIVDNTARKYNLLSRWRPQAVPGIAHLMVMNFW